MERTKYATLEPELALLNERGGRYEKSGGRWIGRHRDVYRIQLSRRSQANLVSIVFYIHSHRPKHYLGVIP